MDISPVLLFGLAKIVPVQEQGMAMGSARLQACCRSFGKGLTCSVFVTAHRIPAGCVYFDVHRL